MADSYAKSWETAEDPTFGGTVEVMRCTERSQSYEHQGVYDPLQSSDETFVVDLRKKTIVYLDQGKVDRSYTVSLTAFHLEPLKPELFERRWKIVWNDERDRKPQAVIDMQRTLNGTIVTDFAVTIPDHGSGWLIFGTCIAN
jgi:hypothetical protein